MYMNNFVYVYICIYICVCVCVCVYIYIYIYAYVNTRLTKTWTASNRLSIIWKSDFFLFFCVTFQKVFKSFKKITTLCL